MIKNVQKDPFFYLPIRTTNPGYWASDTVDWVKALYALGR